MTIDSDDATNDHARGCTTAVIRFTLNGRVEQIEISTNAVLVDLLRERFGLRGAKLSCERGVCGACTTLIEGLPVASCSVFAFEVDCTSVETIENLAASTELSTLQSSFVRCGAFQCGYCTPGMILLASALLRREPSPDDETICAWLESNICRCTGYKMIVEAVQDAASSLHGYDAL